ncbi:VIT1/CCC1 transporter family protein [Bartonella sp. F02]|uniref:VIT1/CCC1 transporter family protein n=1 Tax=Bartonella sp. F02 TaxID=2967262 RepID=UPI0022A90542|nr:hypothetical protein [Bartonella sp. F02]MCZ2328847.1 hypothetical protein [Bartonella sp. F02]
MLTSFFSFIQRKNFSSCSAQEIITRALKSKEARAAFYLKTAKALQPHCPNQAAVFTAMSSQELENYQQLLNFSCEGCVKHGPSLEDPFPFLDDTSAIQNTHHTENVNETTQEQKQKQTLLTWIQPGLAGLMDGSVSTLAPIFAAAFATGDTHQTFMIGLSASIGAGLSMGFTEAAHDDGVLSGRGSPIKRGIASGIMTTLGGMGHTLPYLINSFSLATLIAFLIVFFELGAIVWIQNKFMSTPFWRASLQVLIGGALVFATGVLIGNI